MAVSSLKTMKTMSNSNYYNPSVAQLALISRAQFPAILWLNPPGMLTAFDPIVEVAQIVPLKFTKFWVKGPTLKETLQNSKCINTHMDETKVKKKWVESCKSISSNSPTILTIPTIPAIPAIPTAPKKHHPGSHGFGREIIVSHQDYHRIGGVNLHLWPRAWTSPCGDGSEKKDGIGVQQWFTIHDHYIKWLTSLHSKHGHYIKQRTSPSVFPCCGPGTVLDVGFPVGWFRWFMSTA